MELSKTFTDSKTIAGARYEPEIKRLIITFVTGKVYAYSDVPEHEWIEMLSVSSVGRFVNDNIKGKYQYKLIN